MTDHDNLSRNFIDTLISLKPEANRESITLGDLLDRLDERAFGLMILLLTIPCLVPGLPGAQLIAIPIILLAGQMAMGRTELWLPQRVLAASVKASWITAIADFADKRLRWTTRLSRPRLTFAVSGFGERLVAGAMMLAAITIALPITNTIPSLAITLASVGLIQRDGLFAGAGAILAVGWLSALIILIVGLVTGASFAVGFVSEHFPWLAGLFS